MRKFNAKVVAFVVAVLCSHSLQCHAQAVAVVSPPNLNFGNQPVGVASPSASLTVSNAGDATLAVTNVSIFGFNAADFNVTLNTCGVIPPGGTCSIAVNFQPTAPGNRAATLRVFSNSPTSPNSVSLSGSGAIVPVANFTASPTNGVAPLLVNFTDTSTGTITNRFWSFGDGVTSNTTAANLTHTYTTAGTNTVSLIVTGPLGVSTNTKANLITVINPPILVVTPSSLNFGSVSVGGTNMLSFAVINAGGATLTGTAATSVPFSITGGSPFSIAPGGTGTVSVSFIPLSTGGVTNTVIFSSNGGSSTNLVTGTGLPPKCDAEITVTATCENAGGSGQPIFFSGFVSNNGNIPLPNVTVTSSQAGLVLNTSLPPGGSMSYVGSYVTAGCGDSTNTITAVGRGPCSGFGMVSVTNSASVICSTPCCTSAIAVTKQCQNASGPGQPIFFNGTVINNGAITLIGVTVIDDHAGTVLTGVTLAPNAVTNYFGSYPPAACGPSTDTVFVTANAICLGTTITVTNSASAACSSPCCEPGVSVTKACQGASGLGQPIFFSGQVVNTGNVPLTGVTVVDDHAGVVFSGITLAANSLTNYFGSYLPTACGPSTDTVFVTANAICFGTSITVTDSASAACFVPCVTNAGCSLISLSVNTGNTNCVPLGGTVSVYVIVDQPSSNCFINLSGAINTNVFITGGTNFVGTITCATSGTRTILATVLCQSGNTNIVQSTCVRQFECCGQPGLQVIKEIGCPPNFGTCSFVGNYGKIATGASGVTECPDFCYRITLKNTGNVSVFSNKVVDSVFGDISSFYPSFLPPGTSATQLFVATYCTNVLNTVTATAIANGGTIVTSSDSAMAEVVHASISCVKIVSSPDDLDGNPSDSHVTLPDNGNPHPVFVTARLTAGDAPLTNVFVGDLTFGCEFVTGISLAAHATTNISLCAVEYDCSFGSLTNHLVTEGTVDTSSGICNPAFVSNQCVAVIDCIPSCPTCDEGVVVVDPPGVTIDFNANPPTCTGDADLCAYFTYDKSGPTPDTWKAIFDVGAKKLLVKSGATITTTPVPAKTNNRQAPGIVIKSTCALETEPGSYITVGSVNRQAGDILIQIDGDITINGVVSNSVDGTRGRPGNIIIGTDCGNIVTGPKSRIITYGQDFGGSDINLAACEEGDIVISGLVDASYKSSQASKIRIAAFGGGITIVGTNSFGTEVVAGATRTITSGVSVRSRRDAIAGKIELQAAGNIFVLGNRLLSTAYPNYGAVAIKPQSTNGSSGSNDLVAVSLGGNIVGIDRAFDFANRFNGLNRILLQSAGGITLSVTPSINAGAANNSKAVVSTQGGDTGKGGRNLLRAFNTAIVINSGVQVLADFTGRPGAVGANLLTACTGVSNAGTVAPPDVVPGDDSGVCGGGPDPIFLDCGELGIGF